MNEYNGFSEKERLKGDRIIKNAIENGDLPPLNQTRCCICGQDKGIRQYHCEDYAPENILNDVVPICKRCHLRLHKNIDDNPERWKQYLEDVKNGLRLDPSYDKRYWAEEDDCEEIVDFGKGCLKKIEKGHKKFKKL